MRRGMTLIELLVVCFILVLLVAAAAPLLRSNTEPTIIREASRQVNAYFAEAKAYAAQRGRPVAVVLDRRAAQRQGARDSNVVTRLYLADSPPAYSGDVDSAQVAVWLDPNQSPIPGFTQAPINGNAPRIISLDFQRTGESGMMDSLASQGYFANPNQPAPGDITPFTIRFRHRGTKHPGLAYATGTPGLPAGIAGRSIQYICVSQFGDSMYLVQLNTRPAQPPQPPQPPQPLLQTFSVQLPPQSASDSVLELTNGSAIDLQYSGFGIAGTQFFDPTRNTSGRLAFLFEPDGSLSYIQTAKMYEQPLGRLHLLVGTPNRAIDTLDAANPANRLIPGSNVKGNGYWVSVSTRTGMVTTVEAASAVEDVDVPTAVSQSRSLAVGLQTSGGR